MSAPFIVDDGSSPLLPAIGSSDISICTGSATQQTCLQSLGESVDVSKTNSVMSMIDPSIGPDGMSRFDTVPYLWGTVALMPVRILVYQYRYILLHQGSKQQSHRLGQPAVPLPSLLRQVPVSGTQLCAIDTRAKMNVGRLQNMSGSFNATVQSQVNGANSTATGPVGGAGAANSTGIASGSSVAPNSAVSTNLPVGGSKMTDITGIHRTPLE